MTKVTQCSAAEAARAVPDGATVLVAGSGGGVNEPTDILMALEERFLEEGHPRDLTLVHVSGMGDGQGGGMDHFAHVGMVRRVIGGHWGWTQRMQDMAHRELIQAYCLPQGTLSHLLRDIAAGRPGVISSVGLGTFIDPRLDGGRLNASAVAPINEVIELRGRTWIFTPCFPIDVAIIRGTRADERGNIVADEEGMFAEILPAAQAASNSGGIVLAQVREVVAAESLDPRRVRVPGVLVDRIVACPQQRLSFHTAADPFLSGQQRAPHAAVGPMPMSPRKIIARRAAVEARIGDVVNLGFGMPDGVASALAESGEYGQVTFTVEQGHVGGIPASGPDFGMCINPDASLDAAYQFDWYDGGGIDLAVLSFAEIDASGNVNVSKFGGRMPGVGGFVNISQGARRLVFVGTLTAGASVSLAPDGGMRVTKEGTAKLVTHIQHISFSARQALDAGQSVLYVTERGVFQLTDDGLELIEIAPGVDLQRDVLDVIEFTPKVSAHLVDMQADIFTPDGPARFLKGEPRG